MPRRRIAGDRVAGRLRIGLPGPRDDPRARASRPPARSTTCPTRSLVACSRLRAGRGPSWSTTSPTPTSPRSSGGRGRGRVGRLSGDHLQLGPRRRPAPRYPAPPLHPRRGRRVCRLRPRRPGRQRGDGPPPLGDARGRRRGRPPLAARRRRAGGRRRQRGRGGVDGRRVGRARTRPNCVPRRAGVAVRGQERLAAYRARLEMRHRARRPAGPHAGFDAAAGVDAVDALLAGDATFTAIRCANDLLALGALQRLAELGIDVPSAMSVAGFDDISTAAITAPSLSTVRLPLRSSAARVRARGPRPGRRRAGAPAAADRGGAARVDVRGGDHRRPLQGRPRDGRPPATPRARTAKAS